jgi:hypothetical protein
MSGDWMFLVVLWIASAVVVAIGVRPIADHQLVRWSTRFNVLVDASTKVWLSSLLRRSRGVRWVSFVVGINVGLLPMYMNVIDVERAADYSNQLTAQAPLAIAALGAVLAELTIARRPSGLRTAGLVTRHWSDYVERHWLMLIAGTLPISLIASGIAAFRDVGARWLWVGPAASALGVLAVTVGVRVVVNRPAIDTDTNMQRIDDALRADGAHRVVGAAVAVAGVAACSAVGYALGPTSLLGLIPALGSWALFGVWHGIACNTRWNVDQARLQHA